MRRLTLVTRYTDVTMTAAQQTPRAFSAATKPFPDGFTIWLSGAWGMEHCSQLLSALAATPQASKNVTLDCRRVTLVDSATLHAMTRFADDCASRAVACVFECDDDPIGRLIQVARLDRLTVVQRPLVPAGARTN